MRQHRQICFAVVVLYALDGSTKTTGFQSRLVQTSQPASRTQLLASQWKIPSENPLPSHLLNDEEPQEHKRPLIPILRHLSTVAMVSATLAFSTLMVEPGSVAWADVATPPTETSVLHPSASKKAEETVVDEVWNLIDKYYIDRTFNGRDWKQDRETYLAQAEGADNDQTMKLLNEMVKNLGDKYTRMLDSSQYASIQKFDLIGVGVTLMPNAQKDIIVGAPPIAGSPSQKMGLQSGDFIEKVNGVSTKGRSAFNIIDQISESPNAKTITFSVRRQGENDLSGEGTRFEVTMDRQVAEVKDPVQYKMSEKRADGTNVGYVKVSEFNSLVNARLQDALVDLKRQGANAYVLDLRLNTGGAFQSAVEISGFFYEDRVATYVVDSNEVELPFRAPTGKLAIDLSSPLVVWLDGLSASASEVLAGSLHDNCRAVTMGDKSFGKGLIQAVYGLKNGAGLVLTVAKYITPSGNQIQGIGITPDISGSMPAPAVIPYLSSDTSKVDFHEINKRLDPDVCKVPIEHAAKKGEESSLQ